ncbi:katanin, putative [Leishmania guyanensis]
MFSVSEHRLPCDALYSRIGASRSKPLVGFGGRDASIHIYPFMGYTRTAWLQGLTEPITALAFDPDQTSVVGGSDAGKLQMWDIESEEVVRAFTRGHVSTVTGIDVFRSGQFFATVSTDRVLRIWDVRKSSGRQSYKDATAPLCAVQFSPNGRWVATGCARGTVRLYDLVAGQIVHKFELHSGAITSLHFHPDLYYLVVGSGDGTVSVWDLDSFEARFHSSSQHTPIDAVHFSGTRLLATSDHNLRIFDMSNLSDRTAVSLEAPWIMMSDVAYAGAMDEAWFVETAGSTAMKCKLSLRGIHHPGEEAPRAPAAPPASAPAPALPPQRVPVAALNRNNAILADAQKKPVNGSRLSPMDSPAKATGNDGAERTLRGETPAPSATTLPRLALSTAGPSFPPTPAPLSSAEESELEVLQQLSREHGTVSATLQGRLNTLRAVRTLWTQNQSEAMVHVRRFCEDGQEFGPLFDVLTVLQQPRMKEKMLTESIASVVDLVEIALKTDYEPLILLGLHTLRSIATKFRARVEEAQRRARASQSTGYNDPLGMNQHQHIANKLHDCCPIVFVLAERCDNVGEEAKAVLSDMPPPPRSE